MWEAGGKARVNLGGRLVARRRLIWEAGGIARVNLRGWWQGKG